jgi:hypothetical protein
MMVMISGGDSTDDGSDDDDDSDMVMMKINLNSGKFREDCVIFSSRHQQNHGLIDSIPAPSHWQFPAANIYLCICSLFNVAMSNSVYSIK